MVTVTLRRPALASPAPDELPAGGDLNIRKVYEAHFRYVWRCLRGFGVAEHALEDAAHDVFLVVQRKLPEFDGAQAQVTTWLYEIALRIARRYRAQSAKDTRRITPLLSSEEADAPAPALGTPVADLRSELEHSERLAMARQALDGLDAEKREVFVLGCIEQRSAPEIADITGVPLNTVYSRLRAARRIFAAQVARLEAAAERRAR